METINGLLLDTHALIWWFGGSPRLPAKVRSAIDARDDPVFVSAATAWEIATKVRLGKLPGAEALVPRMAGFLDEQGFEPLPVTFEDGRAAGLLPGAHQDPFDRMLIAQALARDLALVSNEAPFDAYGVSRLW